MTAEPSDEHLPMSDGATALAPQQAPAPAPAPRPARQPPARQPRPRRAGQSPASAQPAERSAPTRRAARPATARSAAPVPTRPAARPAARPGPRATPVSGPTALARARAKAARSQRAPRAPFVILLLVLMGSGLVCLLLLNTSLSENAFQEHSLQTTSSALADEEEALAVQSDRLSAPGALAARAQALGMAPGDLPEYLPAGAPLPPGARVVAGGGDANGGVILYVVPAPGQPAADATPASQGQGQPAADGAAGQPTDAGTSGR
ncbi:hypothetical protein [Pseudofrankia sp. BMG5.37]|uniref:hypothetical protein n=1 Tax=Pseudofrankia sp. BMG5.37 TaxID=3050035 RepID=UPI002894D6AF|nr:hypothetical protein [Pseudofrankia sp. BMG5.37]MDT3441087.1 hypothetical protein [Pseudofrankia sp. BMG5.37]